MKTNKLYYSAKDLKEDIPELSYNNCLSIITEVQKIMKEKNLKIPKSKMKLVLTKELIEYLGI